MINNRNYRDDDFYKVCDFLDTVYGMNNNQHSWLTARWIYAEYLVCPLFTSKGLKDWKSSIRIWETLDNQIVGIVSSENPDQNVFLQIHPKYRFIEKEMIEWAEINLAVFNPQEEKKQIAIWTNDSDGIRKEMLSLLGYKKGDECEYLNVFYFDKKFQEYNLPDSYTVKSMSDGIDILDKCNCAEAAFNSIDLTSSIYIKMQSAPLYRKDLDICVLNDEGKVVSFCTIWYDDIHKIAYYEPVGTHPTYQKKGLGKALLVEGLKRLDKIGAKAVYVGAWGENRKKFYNSAGFDTYDSYRPWIKKF